MAESVEEIMMDLKVESKKVRREQMKLRKNVKKNLVWKLKWKIGNSLFWNY